jgi:hypothetical protein
MFFWFIGGSVLVVWLAFRSPAFDYRLVALGSVFPLVDALTGGASVLHTMLAAAVAFATVLVVTRGHRLVTRRWIGVPIAMMLHLVLDGTFANSTQLWWPLLGGSLDQPLPEVSHLALSLVLELAGIGAMVWMWRRFGLADAGARRRLWRTGQLPRDLVR